MIKAFHNKKLSSMFDYSKNVYPILTDLFYKGIETGEFREHDPKGRAMALMSSLDGLLAYILLDEKLSVDAIVKQYQDIFVNELLK